MKALGIIAAAFIGFVVAPTPAAAYVRAPVAPAAVAPVPSAGLVKDWNDRRYDRGRHHGWGHSRWRWRTVCHSQWRRGHRERVCRRVRYRR